MLLFLKTLNLLKNFNRITASNNNFKENNFNIAISYSNNYNYIQSQNS